MNRGVLTFALRAAVVFWIGGIASSFVTAAPKSTSKAPSAGIFERATFAGGCFWCMESPFDKLPGVKSVVVGYTGGKTKDPTYKEVSGGSTGHAEAVQITFDPQRISYLELLDVYWRNVDPTAVDRQFVDVGTQYRTAIFYHTEKQKREALDSKARLENLGKFKGKVVTEITAASVFYPAESYHQGYYKKNPLEYERYRKGSGRDAFLDGVWGSEQRKAHP